MPMPDYAKTFNELLWVANEATFNTLAYPVVTDAIIPLPGIVLPLPLIELTPSQERRPTPGVSNLIKRKRIVGAWSIPLYLKAAAAAGSVPSWGLLAKKAFGVETINAGTSVVYSLAADQSEQSVTIWQWVDNVMWGFRGCLVNGPEAGLVDFPCLLGGEIVLLCWKYGEPLVAHWHRIPDGFAGRRPLLDSSEEAPTIH